MRIGWVVDHPKRDLAGAVLAAYQLAARGASVVLVPMYEQGVDVPRLGLDTLVVNYARDANLDLMRSFAKAGLAALCARHRRRRAGRKGRQFAAGHGCLCSQQWLCRHPVRLFLLGQPAACCIQRQQDDAIRPAHSDRMPALRFRGAPVANAARPASGAAICWSTPISRWSTPAFPQSPAPNARR